MNNGICNTRMKTSLHATIGVRSNTSGFSLVETVIALGIMGLAVTALLGLLPHGMEMSKKAANAGAEARILDTIRSELGNFSFTGLQGISKKRLAFDEEGMLLDNSAEAVLISYVAEISTAASGGNPVSLPGGSAERLLLNIVAKVASTPNGDFNFETAPANTYRVVPMHFGPAIP